MVTWTLLKQFSRNGWEIQSKTHAKQSESLTNTSATKLGINSKTNRSIGAFRYMPQSISDAANTHFTQLRSWSCRRHSVKLSSACDSTFRHLTFTNTLWTRSVVLAVADAILCAQPLGEDVAFRYTTSNQLREDCDKSATRDRLRPLHVNQRAAGQEPKTSPKSRADCRLVDTRRRPPSRRRLPFHDSRPGKSPESPPRRFNGARLMAPQSDCVGRRRRSGVKSTNNLCSAPKIFLGRLKTVLREFFGGASDSSAMRDSSLSDRRKELYCCIMTYDDWFIVDTSETSAVLRTVQTNWLVKNKSSSELEQCFYS